MTTLAELQALAIEIAEATNAARAIYDPGERWAAYDALHEHYGGAMPRNVSVRALMPQPRTVYRRPHYRFIYYVNGRRATAEAARKALEGAS